MSTTIELGAENRSQTLPPGPRDWLVYRLVKVQQLTTREAAKQLGISQTRICQLIERVVDYMTEVAPGDESPAARGRRLYIAESIAAERIDFLFGQVNAGFQRSVGMQKITRETVVDYGPPKLSTVKKHSNGDARLALAAARLAKMGGTVPANTLLPQLPDDLPLEEVEACESDHPNEDCSKTTSEQPVTTKTAQPEPVVNHSGEEVCSDDSLLEQMLKVLNSRPVQPITWPDSPDAATPQQKRERAAYLEQAAFFSLKE